MAVQIPFPLPSTGFALNSKVRVNLDFIVSKFNEFNTGTATWDAVYIGTPNSSTGPLTFYNSSNANYLTVQAGATASSYTLTLPTSLPASSGLLSSNSSGVMSFVSGTGILYNGSSFTGSAAANNTLPKVSTSGVVTLSDQTWDLTGASNGLLYVTSGVSVNALINGLGSTGVVAIATSGTPAAFSLAGTTNQITVTPGGSSFTFSTPQDIATSSSVIFSRVKVDAGSYSSPGFYFASSTSNTVGLFAEADGTGLNVRAGGSGGSTVFSVDSTGLAISTAELRSPILRATTQLNLTRGAGSMVTIQTLNSAFGSYTLTLPPDDGTSGYVLRTDGAGVLTWVSVASAGGATTALDNLASVAINTTLVSDTNDTDDLGTSSIRWRTGYLATSLDISSTSNQIVLGTTRTVTISAGTPATSSRTWTIPDISGNGTFAALEGTQIFSGSKTFSAAVTISASSGNVLVVDTNAFVVDATNNRVGLGTASPDATIEIEGSAPDFHIDGSASVYTYLDRGATSDEAIHKYMTAGTTVAGIGLDNDGTDNLALYTNNNFGTPLLILSATDIYTNGFTDYSSSSTVTGWSSTSTKEIFYKRIGQLVMVWFRIIGTSNATTASFTVPFTNTSSVPVNNCTFVSDNGTPQTTGGRVSLSAASGTINIFKDMASGAFTNSGTKQVGAGFIMFQTA